MSTEISTNPKTRLLPVLEMVQAGGVYVILSKLNSGDRLAIAGGSTPAETIENARKYVEALSVAISQLEKK